MPFLAFTRSDLFPLWAFGFPFFLAALALAGQAYFTSKRGYMFCGTAKVVTKEANPAKYRFWVCLHIAMILLFFGLSTFGFWL